MGILRQRKRSAEHDDFLEAAFPSTIRSTKAELSSTLCNEIVLSNASLSSEQQERLEMLSGSLQVFDRDSLCGYGEELCQQYASLLGESSTFAYGDVPLRETIVANVAALKKITDQISKGLFNKFLSQKQQVEKLKSSVFFNQKEVKHIEDVLFAALQTRETFQLNGDALQKEMVDVIESFGLAVIALQQVLLSGQDGIDEGMLLLVQKRIDVLLTQKKLAEQTFFLVAKTQRDRQLFLDKTTEAVKVTIPLRRNQVACVVEDVSERNGFLPSRIWKEIDTAEKSEAFMQQWHDERRNIDREELLDYPRVYKRELFLSLLKCRTQKVFLCIDPSVGNADVKNLLRNEDLFSKFLSSSLSIAEKKEIMNYIIEEFGVIFKNRRIFGGVDDQSVCILENKLRWDKKYVSSRSEKAIIDDSMQILSSRFLSSEKKKKRFITLFTEYSLCPSLRSSLMKELSQADYAIHMDRDKVQDIGVCLLPEDLQEVLSVLAKKIIFPGSRTEMLRQNSILSQDQKIAVLDDVSLKVIF